jgi:hypothetical protein
VKKKRFQFWKWFLHHCGQTLQWHMYFTEPNGAYTVRVLECSDYVFLNLRINREVLYFDRQGGPDIQQLPHRSPVFAEKAEIETKRGGKHSVSPSLAYMH